MNNFLRMLLVLSLAFILPGCASVSVQKHWKDPAVAAKKYKKLLVVGIADRAQMRQVFEEVFAGEVGKKGVAGIASYTLTGVEPVRPSRESIEEAVKKTGADGVITTRLVDIKRTKSEQSGFIMTYRGLTNAAGIPVNYASFVSQPVEITQSTEAAIETSLFDSGTGLLVWSLTSGAVNPEGIITVTRDISAIVIEAMARDGLI
jgi:hypothetical protein